MSHGSAPFQEKIIGKIVETPPCVYVENGTAMETVDGVLTLSTRFLSSVAYFGQLWWDRHLACLSRNDRQDACPTNPYPGQVCAPAALPDPK